MRGPDVEIYEVWVDKASRDNTQPYAFASLMRAAAGPDNPSILFSRKFAIQPTGINKWRILMGEPEIGNIRSKLKSLKGDQGFRFKNEATGEWLDADVDEEKKFKPEETAFISGIPPYLWRP